MEWLAAVGTASCAGAGMMAECVLHLALAMQIEHFLTLSSVNAPQPAQCPFLHVLHTCVGCAWSKIAEHTQHGENGGTLIGPVRPASSLAGLLMPSTIAMSSLEEDVTGSRDSMRLGSRVSWLVVARPPAP